jgi:asparagine synthase (glutamine-hydrolysing)
MDYTAIKIIKNLNSVASDAVFINGNTGDFITGGHIFDFESNNTNNDFERMLDKIIEKHYSLWECLKTEENINNIRGSLKESLLEIMKDNVFSHQDLWAVSESIEWSGRQSKFVTATQRSYEFFGYDWRLPMWDPMYMDFWEGVPREYKFKQNLYKEWLFENNWGGVWNDIRVNEFQISSSKVRISRALFKALFLVLGKKRWNKFDKKAFWYFIDNTASTAIEPYFNVLFDHCGARNRNSWIVKKYLHSKAVDFKSLYE